MQSFFDKEKLTSSLKIPKAIQWFFKTINIFSDSISLYFASKLFTTPINFKIPKRELAMDEAAQKKTLHVSSIQKDIHILSYGYSDKKVLLTHGWAGRRTQLYMIANLLLEKGFMVIAFDAPSHGKSTGKTTNLLEYIASIKAINKEFGPFEAAVGHSFGAMAIMNTQAETAIFKRLITVGSGDTMEDILINFANNLGLNANFGHQLKKYFEKKWNIQLIDYDTNEVAKKVKIPVLVIHDVLDGDVAVSCAVNIRLNLKKGTLLLTEGLGHTKILRDKETANRIVNFIKQNK
ncbi:alpha/beta hydrolase [Polaribacter vadi]|uniref:alpha/beta fold hydrolase n=1 Tax=Polaribacter vadi TaxID=1774273 RepID=UPI0030EC9FC1|tara:strand:- start:8102 stop:8977 length:876 start_codon:yes stop_codon:yes gene_type:complete